MSEGKDEDKAADVDKEAKEIERIAELGKTGKVKEAFDKKYGKGKDKK